ESFPAPSAYQQATPKTNGLSNYESVETPAAPTKAEEKPGVFSSLATQFGSEIRQLRSLALGTALGLARDAIARSLPEESGPRVTEIMNSVTEKLGGQVIHGELLESDGHEDGQRHEASSGSRMGREMAAAG